MTATDDVSPDLSLYRRHCIALLRRYFSMSVELGRLPALLGRAFFRTRVRSCRISSFEDAVIFVHDVERCLQQLSPFDQELIARCVLQEYTCEEAARLLHCNEKTIRRRMPDAVDRVTAILVERRLLIVPEQAAQEPRVGDAEAVTVEACRGSTASVPGWVPQLMASELKGCQVPRGDAFVVSSW